MDGERGLVGPPLAQVKRLRPAARGLRARDASGIDRPLETASDAEILAGGTRARCWSCTGG
jgi:hypothetical protein